MFLNYVKVGHLFTNLFPGLLDIYIEYSDLSLLNIDSKKLFYRNNTIDVLA